jgi:hypothetical protein
MTDYNFPSKKNSKNLYIILSHLFLELPLIYLFLKRSRKLTWFKYPKYDYRRIL